MTDISIHALLAESDTSGLSHLRPQLIFQSTLSLRRATGHHSGSGHDLLISIHALLAESDRPRPPRWRHRPDFNPRSPCGERPVVSWMRFANCSISIHALLAESDRGSSSNSSHFEQFQSTLSLRRATNPARIPMRFVIFQSTLSLRRATQSVVHDPRQLRISIHALLAESDRNAWASSGKPCRISIHALLAESDSGTTTINGACINFNPRSPCGERPSTGYSTGKSSENFNPRSPCGERPVKTRPTVRQTHFNPRSPCGERQSSGQPSR